MTTIPTQKPCRRSFCVLAVIAAFSAVTSTFAQGVIMSLPETSLDAPVIRQSKPTPNNSSPAAPGNLLNYGSVSLLTSVSYRYANAEGLPYGSRRIASEIQTITPSVQLDFGQNWSVSYTPSWTYYTARALDDTVDQAFRVRGAVPRQNWLFQFGENYRLASPTLYETNKQTRQETWGTTVSAARSLGSRSSLELNGTLSERYADIGFDSRDWSTQDWYSVQVSPRVNLGIGPTFGYTEIIRAPDMTYQRYLGRITFNPSEKLSLSANGGMEYRQSNARAAKDLSTPIVDAALGYSPFETTTVGLSYSHSVQNSLYQDQVSVGSNWSLTFSQRLLGHLYLSAQWVRSENKYQATTALLIPPLPLDPNAPVLDPIPISLPGRKDKLDSFNYRLSLQVLKRITIAATYQQSDNASNASGFDVSTKQYGFEISGSF